MVEKTDNLNSMISSFDDPSKMDIPIEDLTPIVTNEANSRKNIYRIHKWWARRLGTVFEALIRTALNYDYKQSHSEIREHNIERAHKIVLDPMMGGGTSILESLQFDCKTVGVDINPVSWFITKKEVEPIDIDLLNNTFCSLQTTVGKKIQSFYSTKCSKFHKADIMYVIWNNHVTCKNCSEPITLTQNYIISQKKLKKIVFCPSCFSVHETNTVNEKTACPECKTVINLNEGTVQTGIISCPKCHQKEKVLDAVKRYRGPLPRKMICIEYFCEQCGRGYKKPDISDLSKYDAIQNDFVSIKDDLIYPKEPIPKSVNDNRPLSHGYRYFYQLFNERQLLSLSLLLEEIKKIPDPLIMEFLLLVFSSCLETNNLLCRYETKWQKIASCFGFPAYHPVERIAENNVWGTKYGRGTFTKCFQKLERAKSNKKSATTKRNGPQISNTYKFTEVANSFDELVSTDKNVLLKCKDSESLDFLPSNSIDLVITDPPYFDILEYSRLADFFYVWLRKGLSSYYPSFMDHTSNKKGEIVMDGSPNKELDDLVLFLQKVFSECNRVLKKDGFFIFTFHHTKSWAWKGLAKALNGARFKVISVQHIRSEGRTGFRKKGKISYDACLICKKENEISKKEHCPEAVHEHTKNWIKRLVKAGNNLKSIDIQSIVMGGLLVYNPSFILSNNYSEISNMVKQYFTEY